MARVIASLLSADLLNLERDIRDLESAGVYGLHVDIMDGHFVPNIAFGIDVVERVCKLSSLIVNVHLMISNPMDFIKPIVGCGANYFVSHIEVGDDFSKTIELVRSAGGMPGVAINPETPVSMIEQYLDDVHVVLVMGVEPGFGGQKYIPEVTSKIKRLAEIRNGRGYEIALDGGVDEATAKEARDAGATILVAGSYLFDGIDFESDRIGFLRSKINRLCAQE